jgi:hypothetical protein
MTVNTITTAPAAARARKCPLCDTLPGWPCQDKPAGDHLARYLDAYTAGQLTKQYMAAVVGELVEIDTCTIVSDAAAFCACGHAVESHWEIAEPCGGRAGCAILGCPCEFVSAPADGAR